MPSANQIRTKIQTECGIKLPEIISNEKTTKNVAEDVDGGEIKENKEKEHEMSETKNTKKKRKDRTALHTEYIDRQTKESFYPHAFRFVFSSSSSVRRFYFRVRVRVSILTSERMEENERLD